MELLVSLINVRQFLPFYKLLVESYLSSIRISLVFHEKNVKSWNNRYLKYESLQQWTEHYSCFVSKTKVFIYSQKHMIYPRISYYNFKVIN